MVSTRHHPREFPPPDSSPTKQSSPRKSTRLSTTSSTLPKEEEEGNGSLSMSSTTTTTTRRAIAVAPSPPPSSSPRGWSHTASNLTILWILISLPLTIWDCLYILLRPHTMHGGVLQWPIWKPYEIYAAIDYVYGWPGWNNNDGFGGAQAVLNVVECVLYGLYISVVWNYGRRVERGRGLDVSGEGVMAWVKGGMRVRGRSGNRALLLGFAAAVMTLAKTVLYYFNEYFSGFKNVAHNDWLTIFLFYGVMNGLWVIFPAYMTVVFGTDILEALDLASESESAALKKKY